jgi:hypothetical protein
MAILLGLFDPEDGDGTFLPNLTLSGLRLVSQSPLSNPQMQQSPIVFTQHLQMLYYYFLKSIRVSYNIDHQVNI